MQRKKWTPKYQLASFRFRFSYFACHFSPFFSFSELVRPFIYRNKNTWDGEDVKRKKNVVVQFKHANENDGVNQWVQMEWCWLGLAVCNVWLLVLSLYLVEFNRWFFSWPMQTFSHIQYLNVYVHNVWIWCDDRRVIYLILQPFGYLCIWVLSFYLLLEPIQSTHTHTQTWTSWDSWEWLWHSKPFIQDIQHDRFISRVM